MKITVYHKETAFIILILVVPLMFAGSVRTTEWIATLAVFFTFLHAQMGNRMQEAEAVQDKPAVKNAGRIVFYQILKEGLWVVVSVMTQTWAAWLGAFVFLCHPFWRRYYRRRHPLKAS